MKTKPNRFQNPVFDSVLSSRFNEIIERAKIDAERSASKNHPHESGDRMSSYIGEIHLSHEALIDNVDTEHQVKITLAEVAEKQKATDQQTRELNNRLTKAKEEKVQIDTKCKRVSYPAYLKQLILAELCIAITCSFDGAMSVNIFETWGFSLIEAICMGALFAGVLAIFAQTFLRMINLGTTTWKRRLIAASLSTLLLALFIYMAISRADYLSGAVAKASGAPDIHFSPLPFIFTSILLFIIAVAVDHFYMPTVEQKEAIRDYLRLRKEKKANNAEISRIETQIAAVVQQNNDLRAINASILVYGGALEKSIINNAKRCYDAWKKHNLAHRPDNCRPDCFYEPYPFSFNTNFHSNDNSHENNS